MYAYKLVARCGNMKIRLFFIHEESIGHLEINFSGYFVFLSDLTKVSYQYHGSV